MSTPIHEVPRPQVVSQNLPVNSSDDEGTLSGENDRLNPSNHDARNHLGLNASHSHSQSREEEHRLDDDLTMLQAERAALNAQSSNNMSQKLSKSLSMQRSRSKPEPVDQFDVNTNPIHEKTAAFKPPEHPANNFARAVKRIHDSSFLIRYFSYITPMVALLLVPLLLGALVFKRANVGGVRLMWFSVWLEILWLTLWGGRVWEHHVSLGLQKLNSDSR